MRRLHLLVATTAVLSLAVVAVAAPASPPRRGAGYAGKTAQGHPLRFVVAPEGDLIERFRVRRDLTCRRGKFRTSITGRFEQVRGRIRVSRGGRFHAEGRVRGTRGSRIRSGFICVRGVFRSRGRVVRGRLKERVRLRDGSLCSSGILRFIARTSR
jgi:hypothetical protein